MKRLFAASMLLTVWALSISCGIVTGVKQCGPEQRGAGALGEVVLPDGTTARAAAILSEQRELGRPETEVVRVQGYAQSYSLYGHMTRAELRDGQTPSRLFETYAPGEGLEKWAPNLFGVFRPYAWPLTVDQARALIGSGGLVFEIYTDLPSQPLVRIPLTSTAQPNDAWTPVTGEACG
ncbi:MAG: hypothetical protein M3Z54_01435 [Gemmatimonadota bacterium]|nr:hypothetical protein [Gemmatimonadota bacterium]